MLKVERFGGDSKRSHRRFEEREHTTEKKECRK
jgi:hypothetical protein